MFEGEMSDLVPVRRRRWSRWLQWGASALVLAMLVRALMQADLPRAIALIRRAGPAVGFVLAPFMITMLLDTVAWRRVFALIRRDVPFVRLLAVRLTGEAVLMSLPAGAVFAESLNPVLLRNLCGVPIAESLVTTTAKRWLVMRAQVLYILLSAVLGYRFLRDASVSLIGSRGLPFIVLASALLPLVLSTLLASMLGGGAVVKRLLGHLRRVPVVRFRAWLDRRHEGFAAADARFGELAAHSHATILGPTLLVFAGWLMESVETMLILLVLGTRVGFAEVIAFEAALGLIRSLAFFVPSGLGIQDLGYMAFFQAFGLPDATALGAAFVLVKRAKELVCIVIGYALLFVARHMQPVALVPQAESEEGVRG